MIPLFVVSLVGIACEIALTRYFAIASWSEYGYWIISIAMAGFSASGVLLSIFRDAVERRSRALIEWIPLALLPAMALGYVWTTRIPFNPLELQNPLTCISQLGNIGLYYLALFPLFFLTGSYIGLYFVAYQDEVPRVYAVDLAGAGAGGLVVLALLFVVDPFHLIGWLVVPIAVVAAARVPSGIKPRMAYRAACLAVLLLCEAVVHHFQRGSFNEFKPIYYALNVEGNIVKETRRSPRGLYMILNNFTERLDIDVSNNSGLRSVPPPPDTFGLYKDGHRLTSLPKTGEGEMSYALTALDSIPYHLLTRPRTLLVGTRGGFRISEARTLGARDIDACEPEPIMREMIIAYSNRYMPALITGATILDDFPAQIEGRGRYDLIDVSSDFLDQNAANRYAFTREAFERYLLMLSINGVLSVPISIREFTVYALKVMETARQALLEAGVTAPERQLVLVRSAWNARLLILKKPLTPSQFEATSTWADDLSFDLSYAGGLDLTARPIWNDLPPLAFEETLRGHADTPRDAIREASGRLFARDSNRFRRAYFFDLAATTYDQPFVNSVLRLRELRRILANLALIPREEIPLLINAAVLSQAGLLAAAVLILPLIRWRSRMLSLSIVAGAAAYFSCLGLGYLFIEIYLIERATFFLGDTTTAFALVLAAMLVLSGAGSYWSGRFKSDPKRAVQRAIAVVLLWVPLAALFMNHALQQLGWLPVGVKVAFVLLLVAPVAVALGFPFPLGLRLFRGQHSHFLPWAWSLNGAFSVVSTPAAAIIAASFGFNAVLLSAAILYLTAFAVYPQRVHS